MFLKFYGELLEAQNQPVHSSVSWAAERHLLSALMWTPEIRHVASRKYAGQWREITGPALVSLYTLNSSVNLI